MQYQYYNCTCLESKVFEQKNVERNPLPRIGFPNTLANHRAHTARQREAHGTFLPLSKHVAIGSKVSRPVSDFHSSHQLEAFHHKFCHTSTSGNHDPNANQTVLCLKAWWFWPWLVRFYDRESEDPPVDFSQPFLDQPIERNIQKQIYCLGASGLVKADT